MADRVVHECESVDELVRDVERFPESLAEWRTTVDGIVVCARPRLMITDRVDGSGVTHRSEGWQVAAWTDDLRHQHVIDRPEDWREGIEQAIAAVAAATDTTRPATLRAVRAAAETLREAQAREREATATRDAAVRAAVADGASVPQVAAEAGVSRQLIHRITSR